MPRCSWMGRVVSPLHPPQLRQLSYPFFSSVSSSAIQAVNLWPRRRFLRQLLTPSSSLFRYSVAAVSLAFTHGFHNGSVAKLISATHAIHAFPQN